MSTAAGGVAARAASENELYLEQLLGPGGALEAGTEGYEDRPAQREMARAVMAALEGERHLTVEAGTGTGKTLAYLVPAILSGQRVVVSTATKALQEQIYHKDLPLIADALGLTFKASLMKGRSNYVCLMRWDRFSAQPTFAFQQDADHFPTVQDWLGHTRTGDKADVEDVPEGWEAWREIVSTTDSCVGQKCTSYDDCFIVKLRQEASQSEIIVVNHHLFFADLALRTSSAGQLGGAEVIPRYDAVIFDEAHAIEDVATTFFGASITSGRIRDLVRDAAREAVRTPELAQPLGEAALRVEGRARSFFDAVDVPEYRVRLTPPRLEGALEARARLAEGLDLIAAVVAPHAELDDELESVERRAREQRAALDLVCEIESPDMVHWGERRGGGVSLHAAPIDVAGELRDRLLRRVPTCVFTSATLAAGGSLDFFRDRIGLTDDGENRFEEESLVLDSPFDYEEQAAIYVPARLPEPRHPGFVDAVAEEVLALCAITGGRAFVLCTSRKNMFAIHRALDGSVPWPLLRQGQAPKGALLERFRSRPSVLVATQSFWEGVDVPGDDLSLVIIDKLPFAAPSDPLTEARLESLEAAGKSPFGSYQLPVAALALKQGFGRLIRTRQDRGIVAVCDVRLATRGYRGHFIRTLPPSPRFRDRALLQDWWESGSHSG